MTTALSIKVNREDFLSRLQYVEPGLTKERDEKVSIEQSDCFCFKDGRILSYNDELSCRIPSKLGKEFEGAVKAKPLQLLLSKMREEEVRIEADSSKFIIRGRRKHSSIAMNPDVTLAFSVVERPENWQELPEDFSDALEIVSQCAGSEANRSMQYLHVHPKYIEAMDRFQLARYKIKLGVEEEVLVKSESVKQCLAFGMTKIALTDSWLHFMNQAKLVFSCRRFSDDFPDISSLFGIEDARPVKLPKGLVDTINLAQIFVAKDGDHNYVRVQLEQDKIRLSSSGIYGKYGEWMPLLGYKGEQIAFLIKPDLLKAITTRYNEVLISKERIKVEGGRFQYAAALDAPDEKENGVKE